MVISPLVRVTAANGGLRDGSPSVDLAGAQTLVFGASRAAVERREPSRFTWSNRYVRGRPIEGSICTPGVISDAPSAFRRA